MSKISRDTFSLHESYLLAGPSVLWFGVFLLIPLGVISYYSVLTYSSFSVEHTLTLTPWIDVLTDATVLRVFVETLLTGVVVTLITLLFGYPLAYYLRFHTSQNGGLVLLLFLIIPFWTSGVIRTLGWLPVLGRGGVINQLLLLVGIIDQPLSWLLFSPVSQILGYLQNYVVFMAAPIYIALSQVDEGLLDASETLRGNPVATFRNVTWPLSIPGVVIGSIFVFVLSIGNFAVPQFLSGGSSTISTLIYTAVNQGLNYPSAAALSLTLLVVIFGIVYLALRRVDITELARG
ncbi:ABC transporter permease [Halobellus sp. Atlit-38R]|uniref:ABC transporter permease n=1 Tax=Halobellus sp. Atlit-38R TaxID=2282131 RepID=UPI000EF24D17|nr:ABC transporter permease [Halobellus sp. Atlit-38R]RLM87930.1 ABC transporter permease [Halobellus sp. Atlit-38R]